MTDTSPAMPAAKLPLGVGAIISESFSILFGQFIKVAVLGFVGAFLGFLIQLSLLGFGIASGNGDVAIGISGGAIFLSSLLPIVIYAFVTAMVVQLAYDAKLGQTNGLAAYFGPAIRGILPISLLSVVVGILTALGMIALVVGALWVYAVFYVMVPAVVIDKSGFGAMGRSAELTKDYRWPIVGLFLVMMILGAVLQIAGTFIARAFFASAASIGGQIAFGVVASIVAAVAYGFGGIAVALTYARLREIKEGVSVDDIAKVFD